MVGHPEQSGLGKKTSYEDKYNPLKLFAIARNKKRLDIGIDSHPLPFFGMDVWHHYEVSWLNEKGKPIAAIAEIKIPADSPNLIESKSMKLYFNSLNNTKFASTQIVSEIIKKDLEHCLQAEISVAVMPLAEMQDANLKVRFEGEYLDTLDVDCDIYTVDASLLSVEDKMIEETLCSDLLRSNCLVTGQPDWGSVQIRYQGKKINHAHLLQYIISFRNHVEFGEHCAERIFMDLLRYCKPNKLSVCARYTRRGGIDINCFRTTDPNFKIDNLRLCRQ